MRGRLGPSAGWAGMGKVCDLLPPCHPCADTFRDDLVGLRPLGRCALVTQAAFGMVEVRWDDV